MKQKPHTHRLRTGLLIAAAALPFTALSAQTAEPDVNPPPATESPPPLIDVVPPPVSQTAPPPAVTTGPVPTMEPVVNTEPSGNEPDVVEEASEPAPAPAPRRTVTRRASSPAPASDPVTEEPAPTAEALPAETIAPLAAPADTLPSADLTPPEIVDEPTTNAAAWLWLVAGLALIGALALMLLMRRRRRNEIAYREEAPVVAEPEPMAPAARPAAAAGLSTLIRKVDRPAAKPAAVAAGAGMPAAAAAAPGSPSITLDLRPLRAGVREGSAIVQFELTVGNSGTAAAQDVRIATWLHAADASARSEAERMLIEHPASTMLPWVKPGESMRIESATRLAVGELETDSILPVVVVQARYRKPDGSEGRSTGSFAVGVPLEGELAHFDIENPSGMHESVEARPVRVPERA